MPAWTDIISTAEAAEILECTSDQVARLCRTGRLDSHRLLQRKGGSAIWLTTRAAVLEYKRTRGYRWAWIESPGWTREPETIPTPWT